MRKHHHARRTGPRRILTTIDQPPSTGSDDTTPPHNPDRLIDTDRELDSLCEQFQLRYAHLLDAAIAEHGWALHSVDGEPGIPGYLYTVGLCRYDHHPELVVTGLRARPAAHLLNTLGDQIHAGTRLTSGRQCTDFPSWPRLALLDVDPDASDELLHFANRRYQTPDSPPIDALQVIWSDPAGHLPWEPGWVLPHDSQPILHYAHDPFATPDQDDDTPPRPRHPTG